MKVLRSLTLVALATVLLAGCTATQKVEEKKMEATPEATPVATPAASATPAAEGSEKKMMSYTLADVAKHATKDDCWMAIKGKVYDVTAVTSSGKHPGGPVILQGCGKDATKGFTERGGKGEHSEKAWGFLEGMQIGELSQQVPFTSKETQNTPADAGVFAFWSVQRKNDYSAFTLTVSFFGLEASAFLNVTVMTP